jgi:hypothetical protein
MALPIALFILIGRCGEGKGIKSVGDFEGVGMYRFGVKLACVFALGAVAACAPKPAPIPAPVPPPPVSVVILPPPPPVMPLPPGGAAASTQLPPYGLDGIRITPNRGLSRDEAIWNFRAAINVAALNCQGPVWGVIAQNYNRMIVVHKAQLTKTNAAVDTEYRKRFAGQNALRVRDTRTTELYNYFALPPVRESFCNTALQKSNEALTVPVAAFADYSILGLGDFDNIFLGFYDAYAQYQRDLADWNLKYGLQPTPLPATNPPPVTG